MQRERQKVVLVFFGTGVAAQNAIEQSAFAAEEVDRAQIERNRVSKEALEAVATQNGETGAAGAVANKKVEPHTKL